jgi:hypothetical protein
MRVGDAGRETAVGVLKRALAKGQLTQDEFEARVMAAYRAAIRNDLRPLLEELPEYQAVRSDPRRKGLLARPNGSATALPPFDYRGRVHRSSGVTLGAHKAA